MTTGSRPRRAFGVSDPQLCVRALVEVPSVPFGLAPKDSKMLDRLLGAPPSEVGEMSRYVTVWLSRSSCKGFLSLRRRVAGLFFQVGTQQFHVTASGVSSSQANLGLIQDTACV